MTVLLNEWDQGISGSIEKACQERIPATEQKAERGIH
jgi:hypothetical protein